MPFHHALHSLRALFLLLCLTICLTPALSWGEDDEETTDLFSAWQKQVASPTRVPKPLSQIAENVTVITAADIERLNAHTLAELLQTVPGIQMDYLRTPSTFSFFNIQGAYGTTVLVLIDGIRQNDFDQNNAIPGLIPVQQIERIEIIKGSASAAWGPALGGVINIVTKSPDPERTIGATLSASAGSRFTADGRAEVSGTVDRFGYYLTLGHLRSDGLTPNSATTLNNLYGKISYTLPNNGNLIAGAWLLNAKPGLDERNTASWGFVHDNNEFRRTNSFLKYSQPLANNLKFEFDSYITSRDDHTKFGGLDQGKITFFNDYEVRDQSRGVSARLAWGDGQRNLSTGVEYGHASASYRDLLSTDSASYDRNWDSWGMFVNGAWSLGRFTLLPGIRYDLTGTSGNVTSSTLGATYRLTDDTTLRAYGAQGFSLPSARNRSTNLQKIKTVQAGIETGAVPTFWLKGTWFYNTLRNSESSGQVTITNQDRLGFEIEARTIPFYNLSLACGYTYLYAKKSDTGEQLQTNSEQTVPPHLVKFSLNYDKSDLGLRGTLTGNYVWWNAGPATMAADKGMVWDLHLLWKLFPEQELSPELFLSGHNLFNSVQTTDTELYSNAMRWFEGGMRVSF